MKARTKITFTAGHLCCSTLAMDSKDGTLPPGLIVTGAYSPKERKQDSTHCSAQYYGVTYPPQKRAEGCLSTSHK